MMGNKYGEMVRRKRTFIVWILFVAMMLMPGTVYAGTKDEIDAAKQQKEETKKKMEQMQMKIEELAGLRSDAEQYIQAVDMELSDTEKKIDDFEQQKALKEGEIAATELELQEAKDTEAKQYEAMKLRIQFMYENGNGSYLEAFLTSENFADLLNKAEYVSELTAYDRKMLGEYQDIRQGVEEKEAMLRQEKADLEILIQDAEAEAESYQMLIDAKAEVLAGYEDSIAAGEAEVTALEKDLAAFDDEIAALEEKLKEEQARKVYDGGQFTFPMAWYYRVSSPFGWRQHPIYGTQIFHNGLDMSADTGTEIYAAYGGKVVVSTYSYSAGNYIMIDHGSGVTTLYMHCSKLLVSAGDTVSAGQRIGLVGSTGNSTGPHLHFSVRINGEYVNPAPYIGM